MLRTMATDASDMRDDPSGDAAYVAAAKRDPDAFALLYQRYERRVYAYCLRRLSDPHAAEDAASQVFARAFARLNQCDDRRFRAWLFTIAHHVIADGFRAPKRRETSLDEALSVPDRDLGPEAAALASEAARELATLLASLPADQRRVVELRLAGLTGPEIAAVIGRSHDAVKKLQGRAMVKLRSIVADQHQSEFSERSR